MMMLFLFTSCPNGKGENGGEMPGKIDTAGQAAGEQAAGGEEAGGQEEGQEAGDQETDQEAGMQEAGGRVVRTGAEVLLREKMELLTRKRVAIVANHTSLVGNGTHLVDTLLSRGVSVMQVFSPEHGFRGSADAGEKVSDSRDAKTGISLISLYGNNKKPTAAQLKGIDLVIFDIQDVGVRLYTYISTLSYVMEACAENGIPVLVLDRPNPNGKYTGGPVMQTGYESFIGLHPVPVVHGMTVAEYAKMVNGEGWLAGGRQCELEVVSCEGYRHEMTWEETGLPWVAPSPNLGTEYAAFLYPALVWFEPTPVSLGRGTDDAFTMAGAPWFQPEGLALRTGESRDLYGLRCMSSSFRPVSLPGKAKYPKFENQECRAFRFEGRPGGKELFLAGISLFQEFYRQFNVSGQTGFFFTKGFEKWPGNAEFRKQIEDGLSPEAIYESWQPELDQYREMREKYLVY
jgi:uncharacterized protein YbbC (DUF1343 family)